MSNQKEEVVGVLGAGNFGTALANIIAENTEVILYGRRKKVVEKLQKERSYKNQALHDRIRITNDLEEVAKQCELLFPVVPSGGFPALIREIAPYLKPYHVIIHATKGLSVNLPDDQPLEKVSSLSRKDIFTMSEVIKKESMVLRVGCVAGPNLAREILEGQPAATVVASHFDEVIQRGSAALRTGRFRVHGNHDLLGIELAGVLKNVMAIASGILAGLKYGDNTRALLVTRGLAEITTLGKGLGAEPKAFMGLAGIGDLVATCASPLSRNFTVGYRLAQGETLMEIVNSMEEVAEGVKTVCIARALGMHYKIPIPITQAMYRILFGGMDIHKGISLLMEYPFTEDVEFI